MIETSEILDLSEESSPDRSDDDHQHNGRHVAVLGVGHHPLLAARPSASSHIHLQDIAEMTPNDEQNGTVLSLWLAEAREET